MNGSSSGSKTSATTTVLPDGTIVTDADSSSTTSADGQTTTTGANGSSVSTTVGKPGTSGGSNSGTSYKAVSVNVSKNLAKMPAENFTLLNKNPERGFRLEIAYDVQYDSTAENPAAEVQKKLTSELSKCKAEQIKIAQVYLYLNGYRTSTIKPAGLEFVQTVCDVYRKNGISMLLRFAYQDDIDNGVGASTEMIESYIKQLAPIVKKNKDVIYSYQAGFVGAWGEWHSEKPAVDRAGIMNAIVNNFLEPDMYMMTRLPNYKNYVSKSNKYYKNIGFHNDAFFGHRETTTLGGLYDPDTPTWNQGINESPYVPNDAELFWNADLTNRGLFVDGKLAIQELREHHFTSMSVLHSYLDAPMNARTSMGDWKKTTITKSWLDTMHIPYSNAWFTGKSGKTVTRNAFEYIRDYMGYQLEAQSVKVTGTSAPSSTVTVTMPLKNYGTGAGFNMKSSFVILDKNNKPVATASAGTPATWYGTNPTNFKDQTVLTHTASAKIKLPAAKGQYKLAYSLKNRYGDSARLANNVPYVNGYNILHEFAY